MSMKSKKIGLEPSSKALFVALIKPTVDKISVLHTYLFGGKSEFTRTIVVCVLHLS